MQHVPAIDVETVAAQFHETGDAPDVGGDTEVVRQQRSAGFDFAQNGARAEQLNARGFFLRLHRSQLVHALADAFLGTFGHVAMRIILVQRRDVIEDILILAVHAAQPILNDDGEFIGIGRVIANAVRNGCRDQVAVAILVLKPLAVQRGSA